MNFINYEFRIDLYGTFWIQFFDYKNKFFLRSQIAVFKTDYQEIFNTLRKYSSIVYVQ